MVASIEEQPVGCVYFPHIEVMKWLGLLTMLVDHVNRFVLENAYPSAEIVGSLAFPFFTFALAAGLARSEARDVIRVVYRLAVWGVVAQVGVLLVRDVMPLNILFTFAAGIILAAYVQRKGWWMVVGSLVFSFFVEYSIVGVLFVASCIWSFHQRKLVTAFFPLSLMPFLWLFNDLNHGAFLAVASLPLLGLLPADLPRVRHVFYVIYAAQWPWLYFAGSYGPSFVASVGG